MLLQLKLVRLYIQRNEIFLSPADIPCIHIYIYKLHQQQPRKETEKESLGDCNSLALSLLLQQQCRCIYTHRLSMPCGLLFATTTLFSISRVCVWVRSRRVSSFDFFISLLESLRLTHSLLSLFLLFWTSGYALSLERINIHSLSCCRYGKFTLYNKALVALRDIRCFLPRICESYYARGQWLLL